MNTQAECQSSVPGIPASAPAATVDEVLVDIPSEYITGHEKYSFDAYTLTQCDMGIIFDELHADLERNFKADIDGATSEADFKAFRIEAVHHYQCHEELGGDSYCGVCESYGMVDVDSLEVVRVFDEDGKDYPGWVNQLNHYAKRHNI